MNKGILSFVNAGACSLVNQKNIPGKEWSKYFLFILESPYYNGQKW